MVTPEYFLRYWSLQAAQQSAYIAVGPPVDEEAQSPVHGPDMCAPDHLKAWVDPFGSQGELFGDCMGVMFGCLVVSERAANMISKLSYPKGLTLVPTTIMSLDDDEIGSAISVYYHELARDAVDLVRSGYNAKAGPDEPKFTRTPVLRREILDDADSFPASYGLHICSGRFRQAAIDARLTNFTFGKTIVAD